MQDDPYLKSHHLLADLYTRLQGVRDARKAVVYGLRRAKDVLGADEAVMTTFSAGPLADQGSVFTIPHQGEWDAGLLRAYFLGERPEIPADTLLAPIERRGHNWAVFGLRFAASDPASGDLKALFQVTQALTRIIENVDRARALEVRRKIERKIADREEPKDVMYDILHGLRSLTHYDHSASLFIARQGSGPLTLVAEQIAWTKAKSRRIGMQMVLEDPLRRKLLRGGVLIFKRSGNAWRHPVDGDAAPLAKLLDYGASLNRSVPEEVSMLCAPILTPYGALGLLKISARRSGVLGDYEAELVEEFMPLASLAIQFSVRTETLQERMLRSERKHVLANLARGIAHDVNNALGAMLPLVQQIRADVGNDRLEESELVRDLDHIEHSVQTCRRIFGGMLGLVRETNRTIGHGNVRRAIEGALSVLEDSMTRRSIVVSKSVPRELPVIRGGQGDLTQIFLNLCGNARDAMPKGGELCISARVEEGGVHVEIRDSGHGIPASDLERVVEPFFTTKQNGNGLGLAICRSILWDIGGKMDIESREGRGTRVLLRLPGLE